MRVPATMLGLVVAASLTLSPAFANAPAAPGSKPVKASKPTNVGKPIAPGKPTTSVKPIKSGKPAKSPVSTPLTSVKPAKVSSSKVTSAPRNPIAAKIASKPNLNAKVAGLLPIDPVTGRTMTLDRASLGFKNQGQFIAALHVSQNLGIPFTELKSHMVTRTPGAPGEPPTFAQTGSLGQAIQASKATPNLTSEVERAEFQASADLRLTTTAAPPSTVKKNPTMPRGVR